MKQYGYEQHANTESANRKCRKKKTGELIVNSLQKTSKLD
jgi:hypothetical protein